MVKFWINTGELSGDIHGQALLLALREKDPRVEARGMGGAHLAEAGMETVLHIRDLSVMGFTETLTALPRVFRMLRQIKAELTALKSAGNIDAVILIDAPDFNFRVAKIAAHLGIPVYYYIPPKIWAWRTSRAQFLRKYARKILCILPFETAFYQKHGIGPEQAIFVGNALVDLVNWPALQNLAPDAQRIGIMPGSRRAEIERLMPLFGETARLLHTEHPSVRFVCLRAPTITEKHLRALWPSEVPLTFEDPASRYQVMRSCAFLLAASGTATLEAALAGTPAIIAYKISALSAFIGKRLIHVPWVGLPNLIVGREIFPEYLQQKANPATLAALANQWLKNPDTLACIRRDLDHLRELCGPPGSAERAARIILDDLHTLTGTMAC